MPSENETVREIYRQYAFVFLKNLWTLHILREAKRIGCPSTG